VSSQSALPQSSQSVAASIDAQWRQFGLISCLAERFYEHQWTFGKPALQKLVFLLQTIKGVDCGYDFELSTRGPFSGTLQSDIDIAAALNAIDLFFDQEIGGYRISPGRRGESVRNRVSQFLDRNRPAIDEVVSDFGNLYTKQLELKATVVFVAVAKGDAKALLNSRDIVDIVRAVKPQCDVSAIEGAISEIRIKYYL
jgi:hypothetical protein